MPERVCGWIMAKADTSGTRRRRRGQSSVSGRGARVGLCRKYKKTLNRYNYVVKAREIAHGGRRHQGETTRPHWPPATSVSRWGQRVQMLRWKVQAYTLLRWRPHGQSFAQRKVARASPRNIKAEPIFSPFAYTHYAACHSRDCFYPVTGLVLSPIICGGSDGYRPSRLSATRCAPSELTYKWKTLVKASKVVTAPRGSLIHRRVGGYGFHDIFRWRHFGQARRVAVPQIAQAHGALRGRCLVFRVMSAGLTLL